MTLLIPSSLRTIPLVSSLKDISTEGEKEREREILWGKAGNTRGLLFCGHHLVLQWLTAYVSILL